MPTGPRCSHTPQSSAGIRLHRRSHDVNPVSLMRLPLAHDPLLHSTPTLPTEGDPSISCSTGSQGIRGFAECRWLCAQLWHCSVLNQNGPNFYLPCSDPSLCIAISASPPAQPTSSKGTASPTAFPMAKERRAHCYGPDNVSVYRN